MLPLLLASRRAGIKKVTLKNKVARAMKTF